MEIKLLIEDSVLEVETGARLVGHAGATAPVEEAAAAAGSLHEQARQLADVVGTKSNLLKKAGWLD